MQRGLHPGQGVVARFQQGLHVAQGLGGIEQAGNVNHRVLLQDSAAGPGSGIIGNQLHCAASVTGDYSLIVVRNNKSAITQASAAKYTTAEPPINSTTRLPVRGAILKFPFPLTGNGRYGGNGPV